jgi:hypothetical protein
MVENNKQTANLSSLQKHYNYMLLQQLRTQQSHAPQMVPTHQLLQLCIYMRSTSNNALLQTGSLRLVVKLLKKG